MNSFFQKAEQVVEGPLYDSFLGFVHSGNLPELRKILQEKKITPRNVNIDGSRLTDIALHNFKKNLDGIKLLVGEFHFPVPQDFLSSVYSPAPEVTYYLVEEQGFDLYAKNENQKRDDDDETCSYFSEANIERLRSAVRDYRSIHGIRAQDYRSMLLT